MIRIIFIYRIVFICAILALPQIAVPYFNPSKIFIRNINLENGLSQCVVTDMVSDKQGFIWVGTFDGLNRFDGNNLSVFKHIPKDANSLPSSKILKLFADEHHHIWTRTTTGLSILDSRTGKVIWPASLTSFHITWVGKHDENHIWAYAEDKGLLLINTINFSIKFYNNQLLKFPSVCEAMDVYEIKGNVYVVSTCGDMIKFSIATQKYSYIKNILTNDAVYDNSGLDKFGNICLGALHADMICYETESNRFVPSMFNKKDIHLLSVRSIEYNASNDVLLLGTYGQGLFIYNYLNNTLTQLKKNENEIKLAGNYVQCTATDRNGVIYVGYDGVGFDVLDPFIKKFATITKYDPDDLKSLRFVRKILEDDFGNLLVGTSGSGLVKYNLKNRSFDFYNERNGLNNSDNFIIEMLIVNDEVWLGYNGTGIDILDLKTLQRKGKIAAGKSDLSLSDGVIWSTLNDMKGNIWVGTRGNGINKVNIQTRKIKQFTKTEFPLLSGGMRCMTLLRNGNILVGSENGLFEINTTTDEIKLVMTKLDNTQSIQSYKCIYIDKNDCIWLGTDGAGLEVISKDYKLLNSFNTSNSLNNDVVYGILPENDSTIWISTNAGLSCIHWNSKSLMNNGKVQIVNYDEKNGLQSNEFNTGAYLLMKDGRMAFGGLNGINLFHPHEIKNNPIVPDVYIDEFKVFENPLKHDTLISSLSEIYLKPFENSFSVSFSTIGFSMPGKIQYKYRLAGNDAEWIHAGKRNYVSYTNLSPGDYEFQVKACNYDGVWNDHYTSLKIVIATPYYKTWWFISLLGIVVFLILYSLYKARKKLSTDKAELKLLHTREMAEVEMKALRAQINPHFLFNSLNSINGYILKNDYKMASRYLVKFSQLVRNILNNSSTPYISLSEELNTIELYMKIEGMRFSNQFSYVIDVDPSINPINILIPSLLLQPYVENAIWHGLLHKEGEKQIAIKVRAHSVESICIYIDDNGVGREMAAKIEQKTKTHKSYGMELGESRLKLMNSSYGNISSVEVIDKEDQLHNAEGTTIKIVIPINIFIKEKLSLN